MPSTVLKEDPTATERLLRVLTVDDDSRIRKMLTLCLEGDGHEVRSARTTGDALVAAAEDTFDVVFLDQRLGADSGIDIIPGLLNVAPHAKIVVITAFASIENAVEAMRRGASDYLPKPFTPEQVRLVLRKAAQLLALEQEVEALREDLQWTRPNTRLESNNAEMRRVFSMMRQVGDSDATVLFRGESGTGKTVLARALHAWSRRADDPYVVVHGPSLSANLFESELFGHVKGAFTGATQSNPGRVARADGGTLFLDEIGDLPMNLQPKLLRFIQEGAFERVGDPETHSADVRILAATNQDLEMAVAEGRFREDLFYRLNVIEIEAPPLRERPEDILPLARQFLAFFGEKYNRDARSFSPEAQAALPRHGWPGNVRELQNVVERAVILAQPGEIDAEHLPFTAGVHSATPHVGTLVSLSKLEEVHILRVIEATETLEEAAAVLGIDPATLWRRRRQYDA